MAFRIEKNIGSILILLCSGAFAQPVHRDVRHEHLHGGASGVLRIGSEGIGFEEQGKNKSHSRQWNYEDIQQLSLSGGRLRILTYEDQKWQLGRDREYAFDHLPQDAARQLRTFLRQHLGKRFIDEIGDRESKSFWESGAKLRHSFGGTQGTLQFSEDCIVYQTDRDEESRTWRFEDIDNISSSGPFELTITTLERSDWKHAGPREFRFQLKRELPEDAYNRIWKKVEQTKRRIATDG